MKKTAVVLIARERAILEAKKMLDLENQIAALQATANELKESLKNYVTETGDTDLEVYTVTESEAKPKLNFGSLTSNAQKRVVEILMAELPEFVKSKTELDTERMYYAMNSNAGVRNTLQVHGLQFDLVKSLTFRKVK